VRTKRGKGEITVAPPFYDHRRRRGPGASPGLCCCDIATTLARLAGTCRVKLPSAHRPLFVRCGLAKCAGQRGQLVLRGPNAAETGSKRITYQNATNATVASYQAPVVKSR